MGMRKWVSRRTAAATAAAAAVLFVGPMAMSATARPAIPPITVAHTIQVVLLPPSPCRPAEFGGATCVGIGTVAQVYLLPHSPCSGRVCLPVELPFQH